MTKTTFTINHEAESNEGGFYLEDEAGERLGELLYSSAGKQKVSFDHTWVDDSLRGQGKARELLDAGVEWARAEGLRIVPVCPYVEKQFDEDPSLADVRAG